MKTLYTMAMIFFVSLTFSQTIPITPSIVSFYQDSTSFHCAAVNGVDSLELDLDADSIVDIRLKVYLTLDSCPRNMNPYLRREMTFETFDSTYLLSNLDTVISQDIPEEFFPGQVVNPANYLDSDSGYIYEISFRQNSPTNCTAINAGHSVLFAPYTHHFLAKKSQSGVDYYYLFGLQFDSFFACMRLRIPVISNVIEKATKKSLKVFMTKNQLSVESDTEDHIYIEVYDLGGRMIDQFNVLNGSGSRDFSQLAPGLYLIKAMKASKVIGSYKVINE